MFLSFSFARAKARAAALDCSEPRGKSAGFKLVVGYRTLEEGQQVEFTVVQGPKGLQAQEVTKAT